MTARKSNRYWLLSAIVLVVITGMGGIVAWFRYSPSQAIEISPAESQEFQGSIYIGGAVATPGFYPFAGNDSVEALLQAAGGIGGNANLSELRLYVPEAKAEAEPQRIDINRADAWLLEALPGIGETLARRIVDYRSKNGPFHTTAEVVKVAGIESATYEKIKNLITVADS